MAVNMNETVQFHTVAWQRQLDEGIRRSWTDLVDRRQEAMPSQRPEWWEIARSIWPEEQWRIVMITQEDQPIAVIPLVRRSRWTWSVLNHLIPDFLPVVIAPGSEQTAWMGIGQWLPQTPDIRQLFLGHSADTARTDAFRHASTAAGFTAHLMQAMPAVDIALTDSEDAFLASLSAKARGNIRYAERLMRKNYPDLQIDVITEPASAGEAIETLIGLYREHWHDRIGGCILDDPRMARFFTETTEFLLQHGQSKLFTLRVEGRIVAVNLGWCRAGQRIAYLPFVARDMRALPNRYSPGIVLLVEMIRHLRALGVEVLHMGSGSSWYKLEFNGASHDQWALTAFPSTLNAAVVPRVEEVVHVLRRIPVHLAYHLQRIGRRVIMAR
ncbi:MAG: GNAT family N-acetyltransferase [Armatimonadota bacterium]